MYKCSKQTCEVTRRRQCKQILLLGTGQGHFFACTKKQLYLVLWPEGRPDYSDAPRPPPPPHPPPPHPCLESQGCYLILCFYLLPCYSAYSPVAHSVFSLFLHLTQSIWPTFQTCLYFFFFKDSLFCIALVFSCCFLRLVYDKLVGGKCSVLAYLMATVLAIYAFRHVSFLIS